MLFALYLWRTNEFILRTISWLACASALQILPSRDHLEPFLSLFVIFPATRGKIYPHLDKKFWLCRDGFISVATKNIGQGQKPVSAWLDIFQLYLSQIDNFISRTFSRLARTAVQKCSQPKPFPFPFVIIPAAREKTYPHLDKKFWLCRDRSVVLISVQLILIYAAKRRERSHRIECDSSFLKRGAVSGF